MSRRIEALREVFRTLADEQRGTEDLRSSLETELGRLESMQPWYVRTMIGFGAWLASLLLIVFVVGVSSFATESPFIVLGLLSIAAALIVRWRTDSDFPKQAALAASLAGQGLLVFAIAELSDDFTQSPFLALALVNAVLLGLYPDRTHRFFSVLLIVGSLTILLYAWEAQFAMPLLGPLLALGWVFALEHETTLSEIGFGEFVSPVREGLLISAFGCLSLSTMYVLPELADDFAFYPRPWISTLLLGGVLLRAVHSIMPCVFPDAPAATRIVIYALTVTVLATVWTAPGIVLALLVIAFASLHGHNWARGAGIAFLATFIATYFYGSEIGMLAKSASLIAAGVVLLVCRWLLLRVVADDAHA